MERKLTAVQLILTGSSLVQTAKAIGISETAIHKWLKDERFQGLLKDGWERLAQEIFGSVFREAKKILDDPEAEPKVKAMVVNEGLRQWGNLERVRMQRIKAPRQQITVGFEAADGRRVAVQVGGETRALPVGEDDSGTDTDD